MVTGNTPAPLALGWDGSPERFLTLDGQRIRPLSIERLARLQTAVLTT